MSRRYPRRYRPRAVPRATTIVRESPQFRGEAGSEAKPRTAPRTSAPDRLVQQSQPRQSPQSAAPAPTKPAKPAPPTRAQQGVTQPAQPVHQPNAEQAESAGPGQPPVVGSKPSADREPSVREQSSRTASARLAPPPAVASSTARARRVAPIEHSKYRNVPVERETESQPRNRSRAGLLARYRSRSDRKASEPVVAARTAQPGPTEIVPPKQPPRSAQSVPAVEPEPAPQAVLLTPPERSSKIVPATQPVRPAQALPATQPARETTHHSTPPHLVIGPAAEFRPSISVWHDYEQPADLRSIGGRWLLPVIAIGAVVMIALASGVLIFLHGRGDTSPVVATSGVPSAGATGPIAAAAEAWLRGNATSNERVLTDSRYTVALERSGLPLRVTSYSADVKSTGVGSSIVSSYDYVLSTPDLRKAGVRAEPRLASALQSAIPIAYFGAQPDQVQVLRVSGLSPAQIAARRSKDVLARKMAGQSLLDNPALTYSTAISAVLGAGNLDLRPATVLAQLCSSTPVEITGVTATPAETAAGMPVRRIRIRPAEPNELAPVLNGMPTQFRPDSIIRSDDGSSTLTWSPMPLPQLVS
ncbi:MAG: hypothetical protein JWN95_2903 [Frankiales bacterium]|nr:hypothetical protein [Frankiales bacterium]